MRFPFNFRDWNCLLVSKGHDGVEPGGLAGGPDTEDDTTRRLKPTAAGPNRDRDEDKAPAGVYADAE